MELKKQNLLDNVACDVEQYDPLVKILDAGEIGLVLIWEKGSSWQRDKRSSKGGSQ